MNLFIIFIYFFLFQTATSMDLFITNLEGSDCTQFLHGKISLSFKDKKGIFDVERYSVNVKDISQNILNIQEYKDAEVVKLFSNYSGFISSGIAENTLDLISQFHHISINVFYIFEPHGWVKSPESTETYYSIGGCFQDKLTSTNEYYLIVVKKLNNNYYYSFVTIPSSATEFNLTADDDSNFHLTKDSHVILDDVTKVKFIEEWVDFMKNYHTIMNNFYSKHKDISERELSHHGGSKTLEIMHRGGNSSLVEGSDDEELDTSKPTNKKKYTQDYEQMIPNQSTQLISNEILNSTVFIKNQFMQTCDAYIVTERVLLVHPDCKIIKYDLGLKLQNRGTHEIYTIKSIYHSNPLWKLGLTYIVTNERIDKNKIIGISCAVCHYDYLDVNPKHIEFFKVRNNYYIGYLYVPASQMVINTREIAEWLLQDIIDATPIDMDTFSINFTDIYPFSDTIATQILTSKNPSCASDEKCGSKLENLLLHVKDQKIQINGNYTLLICKSKLDRPNKCFEINKAQYTSHCLWLYKSETTHNIKVIDPILDSPMSYDAYLNIIAAPGHLESIKSEAVAVIGPPSLNCLLYGTIDEFR